MNFLQIVFVSKYPNERLVVETEGEVTESQHEELALVETVDGSQSLSLDRMISGLCRRAEPAAAVDGLPACVAAARCRARAGTVFLC